MTSRLERLFVLLESGSSAVTRRAAAQQLGEVQRLRPHELHRLLARVYTYLKSPAWETRIAAGQAIEAILKNVPQWDPPPCEIVDDKKHAESETFESGRLRFDTFDIEKVLAQGVHLMGSEGKEYDLEDDSTPGMDMREKLARQRQMLNARLGLDMACKLGMDMTDVFSNEDLAPTAPSLLPKACIKKPVRELVPPGSALSSRERNRARRKARQQQQRGPPVAPPSEDGSCSPGEPDKKRFKADPDESVPLLGEWVPDVDGSWGPEALWWPLEGWAGALAGELFSAHWEARHGAATALRDLLKSHGKGAGRERGLSALQMEEMHQSWLEDISLRLLCVLALDRFGDFVSDQVVAPVRETCAQCLGVTASLMGARGTSRVASALALLARQPHWEARHGALLGLKYLIAIQQDSGQATESFPTVVRALWDNVDDVAAGAASALVPGSRALVLGAPEALPAVVRRLRWLLATQDELAAACGCYMALLAALLAEPEINTLLGPKYLASVVPRLWPYLSHPTSSIRRAALQTLRTLTRCPGIITPTHPHQPSQEDTDPHHDAKTKPKNGEIKTDDQIKEESVKDANGMSNGSTISMDWLHDLVDDDEYEGEDVVWSSQLLQDALRHVFQRVLVEHIQDIQAIAEEVWNSLVGCSSLELLLHASCPFMSTWICLTMQPARIPFDPTQLIHSKPLLADKVIQENLSSAGQGLGSNGSLCQRWYVGGSETTALSVREANVTRTRCIAARMLGFLSCYIIKPAPGIVYTDIDSPIDCYIKVVLVYLSSKSALQRLVVGLVVSWWARLDDSASPSPPDLVSKLHHCLTNPIYFDEIAVTCTRILQETRDFVAMLRHYKITEMEDNSNILSLEQVVQICGVQDLITKSKMKRNKISTSLEDRRKSILSSAIQCSAEQNALNVATLAALAGACANLRALPEKLNPVIKPLMESIKREENEQLQRISAANLAELLKQCVERPTCPNAKVLSNLCTFLRSDTEFSPKLYAPNRDQAAHENCYGILTLSTQQRQAERAVFKRSPSVASGPSVACGAGGPGVAGPSAQRGPGRPPATDIPLEELFPTEDESQKYCRIQRRGASFALISLTTHFGEQLPETLPKLWDIISQPFSDATHDDVEELMTGLQVLEVVAEAVAGALWPRLLGGLPALAALLQHPLKAVRHMAARCLATLAAIHSPTVMLVVVDKVVAMLGAVECDRKRQGAAEALACIVDKLQINIVPYIVLLVVPLLGRMSDHDEPVRLMSTHCFATLIQLMPLDGAVREAQTLPPQLAQQRERDRCFLDQLFNPRAIGDYRVPVEVRAELRSYQQAGVNWLAFLNKYKLHGVLCDDMGLGKTLQSICMVAGDHHERQLRYRETRSPDCSPLPSLVVCPPTLTGHWVYEVRKFLSSKYLNPLHYTGPPVERERLRTKVKQHNLIVASYDIVRKDIEFFTSIKWNYCILDEGHFIKNGKTKASKAIKTLVANHRLILSGTPIQNNVLELWSLFDFLMPGLLGTERQFTARYSRPILAARDPKATPHHQEAGALAMEALHRQVLPFLLRRMKEDVLTELPSKITQDYYCELSPLQRRLYEDFSRVHMPHGLPREHHHVFQALRYLQNVCNHPKLVLSQQHPEYATVIRDLEQQNSSLDDIQHSAKLPALKQLLLDCGIGCPPSESAFILSQHRALIFCQLKGMLDVVEKDLLRPLLPHVSYLRLDGSVPPGQRHSLVQRFNNDPSIDVLLLTTQVGGLGLNLTGADTVIFVEHDWNPMKDLQAMDRAHRIGQKKVVNVYRLITRATLEEKIMGLQKFKLLTASTVISSENAALETMGTDQLLDLFHLDTLKHAKAGSSSSMADSGPANMKTILDNLPDLWDDQQYETEYDMANFVKSLAK